MATVAVANTTTNISGQTVLLAARDQTITGQHTFDRDPSAPFVVTSGSAVVSNLDADKVDGQDGAYYLSLANATNWSTASLAWSTYTPTITASSGTFTSVSATGRYAEMGTICFVQAVITITTNGTAAGYIKVPLPIGAAAQAHTLSGIEVASTGISVNGYIASGASEIAVRKYDGTYLGANGYVIVIDGFYEVA